MLRPNIAATASVDSFTYSLASILNQASQGKYEGGWTEDLPEYPTLKDNALLQQLNMGKK